ncbi:MAG: lysylphosphatidylglycerol synthase transmembrane domain-containing protein [Saprospiraceae bacterium]|nr:lysylphosphatidylglycerol synthase transmembrane domain-containing protein [Saprospiraceae bacterium]
MVRQGARIVAFISLGLIALFLVYKSQQSDTDQNLLERLMSDFQQARPPYLIMMSAAFMLSNILRALRWQLMLRPMGISISFFNALASIMVAYLTNLVIPRAGEIARATTVAKYEDISFEKALGTVVLDRLLDLLCLLLVGMLTVLLAYDLIFAYFDRHFDLASRWQAMQAGKLLFMVLALVLVLAAMIWFTKTQWYQHKLKTRVNVFVAGLWEGLTSIRNIQKPALFLLYSFGIWFLYFYMAYILFGALQATAHLHWIAGLVVFFFGSLGIVFPSPGGMGSYHFLAIESLSLYQIDATTAFTYANLSFFTIQVFTIIGFGVLSLVLLPRFNKPQPSIK